ncbi:Crp/Fnr family transcriptional regulator [Elizabethkingia miricola]|uniref:Crp/Fnr family transcriptional regulator n=1 Tax=Elizabethkingia miricola TaxID=172045 RepID=A0ABD5B4X3_ELIMR|nr:Crp/Fnr family transcriptional regulator [Elizabethkingia miricola]MDQ8748795.1 Crp/Fnr family transcriptional regulator [Elizabethkingia miricola]NHQ67526.1 Crp/Fnr family transcriptional regulator [Elizabethkingia miricola]NHQ72038.1 Crp/Fnr family transcriptional regulator [Elizabethkingia miricola]NHQ78886.1 Crp/Fnr family transcriptional regulator [Elizabethkingia miricola]OPB88405.1 cyclic nucleotide-binding protein [Elizabethkingia miricola]
MNLLYEYICGVEPAFTSADFELLTKDFRMKHFKKGDHIVREGETQRNIYFVEKGIQMYNFDTLDKTNILGFAYPPNLCVVIESFIFQKPSAYNVTCITGSTLNYLNYSTLQEIFEKSRQIERLFRKLSENLSIGLINRQIELRSTTIEERFKVFCQRSPHLLQKVPQKYIAAYLAIDPTNFSKLMNSVRF